ncbi:hypothetical protein KM1_028200 [Entamoeba histolytica HM-3:IMSS]|uniref:Uncharacterized protein n=1 Tax=Entamoeba histolytica HM-3:IMSS TaxID=885315 RepID=M7WID6_ENTHI|nr:hypothetical protein KM1_028200 [Entamoeba histolytica HM-3:IMSS]
MQLLLIIIGWIFALIFLFNNSIKEYPILRSLIKSLPIIFDILFISIQYSTSFEVYMIIGLIWCCLFYATIIVTAFYSSLHFLFNSNQYNLLSRFLCSIGYFYFVLSDLILFQMVFNKPSSLKRFWCMITYYIAQSLLCVGTVMTMNVQPSFLRNIN